MTGESRTDIVGDIEFTTNGITVWVNDANGMCLGRFGVRGIDVHRTAVEQIIGLPQCLECVERAGNLDLEWSAFVAAMALHHEIAVPATFKPKGKTQ